MLHQLIQNSTPYRERQAVVTSQSAVTWGALTAGVAELYGPFADLAGQRVGLVMRPAWTSFAALAVLDGLAADVLLLGNDTDTQARQTLAHDLKLSACVDYYDSRWQQQRFAEAQPKSDAGSVTILTSGTSGKPKAARHTWASLSRPVRRRPTDDVQRWLLSYRPNLYAGLQVALQCLVNYGTLVIPAPDASPDQIVTLMRHAEVQYASATPSYWRRLLLFSDPQKLRQLRLRQITLGGESVDQQLLATLQNIFPATRIVHIYATTELGRCFSVTDGQAGFPARFLDETSRDGVDLRIDDGQLLVRSANAMRGYDACTPTATGQAESPSDGWVRTGDLVQQQGDRVYFVGRSSEMINVGGNKVHPLEVEQIVRAVPGVADARVYGQASSIAGQLVACDIVAAQDYDPAQVRQSVIQRCAENLTVYQRPRIVNLVADIDLSSAGKVRR